MPLTPDGRIRSKDIGTGEVNSRVINDLHSENYDGSTTIPEQKPGTNGWAIFKDGTFIANDGIYRGKVVAATIEGGTITGAVIEGATLIGEIIDGATITGSTITGSTLNAGSGLVVIDSSGITVGSDVVLDSAGLHVNGGDVRAIDVASDEASATGVTLSTTMSDKANFTLAVPTWASSISIICFATVQSSDGGFGPLGVRAQARIDDVDDGGAQTDTDGLATLAVHITEKTLVTFGSTVKCSVYAGRNGGSGDPTNATVSVRARALFLR